MCMSMVTVQLEFQEHRTIFQEYAVFLGIHRNVMIPYHIPDYITSIEIYYVLQTKFYSITLRKRS